MDENTIGKVYRLRGVFQGEDRYSLEFFLAGAEMTFSQFGQKVYTYSYSTWLSDWGNEDFRLILGRLNPETLEGEWPREVDVILYGVFLTEKAPLEKAVPMLGQLLGVDESDIKFYNICFDTAGIPSSR